MFQERPAERERGLHLADRVVDRDAGSLVEDLDAEDLGRCLGSVFVGAGEGDVEGQDLVAVYQGVASSCRPPTSDNVRLSISSMVAPTERMTELVKMAEPSTIES